ncbi:hypothetical protein [Candidatus Solirubrobacter pratensis]|uniref:hypothetical protein n=1 Tax=Candidatus Solirubrobacter pratensis TaxID=1298857 RepID=UPI0012DD3DFC|nr:hypothetical protein [Candidatus Solirubrobacter pratensis]
MNAEHEERGELIGSALEAGIEGMVFANSPEMWKALYGKKNEDEEFPADEDVDWVQPGSPEFKAMLEQAAASGVFELDD